jgi:hypothetical protein
MYAEPIRKIALPCASDAENLRFHGLKACRRGQFRLQGELNRTSKRKSRLSRKDTVGQSTMKFGTTLRNRGSIQILKLAIAYTFISAAWLAIAVCAAAADGGKSKVEPYSAEIALGPADSSNRYCTFSANIDPVLFYLTSFANQYRVVHIRVINRSTVPLILSQSKDTVELRFGGHSVYGILDVTSVAPQLWKSLSLELRRLIAYPLRVEPGEEEPVYVFVAVDRLSEFEAARTTPSNIRYSIDTLGHSIDLRPPATAAAS